MKKSDLKQLKELGLNDLNKLVEEKRSALLKLRFDLTMGKLKNISEIRKLKKDIAQILTIINEKRLKDNNK